MEEQENRAFESDGISNIDLLNGTPFSKDLSFNIVNSFFIGSDSLTIGTMGKWKI
ncbi:MAG: hypothetical protein RIC95_08570 [Vicingaceae bacterium]